jgi:hypothetical protein
VACSRLLPLALLAFTLTGCTPTVGSAHPTYNPAPTGVDTAPVIVVADAPPNPPQSHRPAAAPAAVPVAATPPAAPPVIVVADAPRQAAKPEQPPATTTVAIVAPTTAPARATPKPPATQTGPYIDKILAVEGDRCPFTYLTGRTADGQPMACRSTGDGARWQPL